MGQRILEELELDREMDTLAHWLAHYLAEKMERAAVAPEGTAGEADRQECVGLILRLWERRQKWPLSAPLKDIADQLNNLLTPKPRFFHDPSKNNTNPFLDLLHELDALHRRETQVCLAAWAAGLDLDKSREYLQNHTEHLDDAEHEITQRLTQIQNLMLSPEAHLDGEACADFSTLSGVERGKLVRERLRSIAKSRTKALGRS